MGGESAIAYDIAPVSGGGFVITGSIDSDILLLKISDEGDNLLLRRFFPGAINIGYSIKPATDGGFIIAGETNGNILLLKSDANGNQAWATIIDRQGMDSGRSVVLTPDKGFALLGYIDSLSSNFTHLIKTNEAGGIEWRQSHFDCTWGYDIKNTPDGGFILCGEACGPNANLEDVYLVKTDSRGRVN